MRKEITSRSRQSRHIIDRRRNQTECRKDDFPLVKGFWRQWGEHLLALTPLLCHFTVIPNMMQSSEGSPSCYNLLFYSDQCFIWSWLPVVTEVTLKRDFDGYLASSHSVHDKICHHSASVSMRTTFVVMGAGAQLRDPAGQWGRGGGPGRPQPASKMEVQRRDCVSKTHWATFSKREKTGWVHRCDLRVVDMDSPLCCV